MREKLVLDLMMYGKYRSERLKRNDKGEKIYDKTDKNGKVVFKKERVWITHSKEAGDKGIYPSINTIYVKKFGRLSYTEAANNKYEEWQLAIRIWMDDVDWTTVEEKVYVDFEFYLPNDNKTRDTHNVFKMNLDTMKGLIFKDDDVCLPRIMDYTKCKPGETPRMEITIHTKAEYDRLYPRVVAAEHVDIA